MLAEALTEKPVGLGQPIEPGPTKPIEWVEVVAPGEKVLLVSGTEAVEVTILRYFFSPEGLKYQLKHEDPNVRWTIEASAVQPMNGVTKMIRYNPNTGEEQPVS